MMAMLISTLQNNPPEIPIRLGPCFVDAGVRALTRYQVIPVEGALRAPLESGLMHRVHAVLCRGVRTVRLDLLRLSSIDAAGVGELVAVFNATKAAGGVLYISHAGRRVRRMLEATGVYAMLTAHNAPQNSR
jgi:anti-anti-sigma factor